MIDGLKERKEEVLRLYADYLPFRERHGDNTDSGKLENKLANIRDGKFVLIVAGEAKSGKSTFINAFLGIEILPMDVKQCTSALIEINYGEGITLEASYADGRKESFAGEGAVRNFLEKHAALSDDYRKIPVTSINNEILIKSKSNVKDSDVQALIEGVRDDNIFNLPQDEYAALIRDYIKEWKGRWQDIVTRINITYPFSKDMREITIIDSPGVNAAGKVGDITNQYIEKADAIIFVKPLTGQAAESSSFRNFLGSNTVGRSKGALLLVLTRKSDLNDGEVFTLRGHAADMYKRSIPEERITAVDSKVQLIFHKCQNMSTDEIHNFLEEIDFSAAENCWHRAEKVRSEFLSLLEKKSNFRKIGDMLDEFATKAHYVQLCDFLTMISEGYETIQTTLEEKIDILRKSAEDPAKLKEEICIKQDEIEEVKLKMHEGIEHILREYTNQESGLIKLEAEKVFDDFKRDFTVAKDFNDIEKKTLAGQDAFFDFQEKLRDQLIAACNQSLIEVTDKTSLSVATIIPRLSKGDFEIMKSDTEENAKDLEEYTEGHCWWKKTQTRSVYSMEKHIDFLKGEILKNLDNTKARMVNSLHEDVKKITAKYREKLKENMDKKKLEYDDLENRLTTAKEMREEMENIAEDLPAIRHNAENVQVITGGIKSVIG
jgi:energy-coupling factor transporter ATP-binding protein EcfA2